LPNEICMDMSDGKEVTTIDNYKYFTLVSPIYTGVVGNRT